MLGREAPLDFFRRCGLRSARRLAPAQADQPGRDHSAFCVFIYHWKTGGVYLGISESVRAPSLVPVQRSGLVGGARASVCESRKHPRHAADYARRARLLLLARLHPLRRRSLGCAGFAGRERLTSPRRRSSSWRSRSCRSSSCRTSSCRGSGNNGWFDRHRQDMADASLPEATRTTAMGANTGGLSVSSWRGRSLFTTSSPSSRCGPG